MALFYGWGSTVLRLQSHYKDMFDSYSLVPKSSCYSTDQPWKDEKMSWPWSHLVVFNPLFTTRSLLHKHKHHFQTHQVMFSPSLCNVNDFDFMGKGCLKVVNVYLEFVIFMNISLNVEGGSKKDKLRRGCLKRRWRLQRNYASFAYFL